MVVLVVGWRTLKFMASALAVLGFAASAYSSDQCETLFTPPPSASAQITLSQGALPQQRQNPVSPKDPFTRVRIRQEIENSRKASRFFMTELRKESDALKTENKGKTIELDWVCMGAGPQCAAASLVLGRANQRALVVEKSDIVAKTFAEKDFHINSSETDTLSMHDFPGGIGSLAMHTSQKYAHSSQLAAHVQQQQYASNVPILLGTKITEVRVVEKDGETFVEALTDQGITLRSKHFVAGTGLGEVATKVQDPKYRKAFDSYLELHLAQPEKLFPIMSTDSFLVAIKNAREAGMKVRLPEQILVVGNGDGSRVSIEGFREPHVEIPEHLKITWIGNDAKTAEQYVASQRGYDRYEQSIASFYSANQIIGVPGHAQTWSQLPKGKMRMTTLEKESGRRTSLEGEMIIDATGYDLAGPGILKSLGADPQLRDVTGALPELDLTSTVLMRQAARPDGTLLPVYFPGASAGHLATRSELADSPNMNSISLFNTLPRTSMAISNLLGVPAFPSHRGARDSRPSVKSSDEMVSEAKRKREEQRQESLRSQTSGADFIPPRPQFTPLTG